MGSWAMAYEDISSLKADADLVVVGEIAGCPNVVSEEVGAAPVTSTLHTSYFSFEVDSVLRGQTSQSTIVVVQTGGIVGGKTVEFMDDPLMQTGDRYVVFLREARPNLYVVLGGPQGRFVVDDGRVCSLSAVHADSGIIDLSIKDMPLEAFTERIGQ